METRQIIELYGEPGSNQAYCKLPYKMKLAWDNDVEITRFSCHEKVREPLESIFTQVLDHYGEDDIIRLGLDQFGGCLNIRPITGGKRLSLHSWGIAVDIDPTHNRYNWDCKKARLAKDEYFRFWEIVESFGGHSLGRQRDYDWMHFQFLPI